MMCWLESFGILLGMIFGVIGVVVLFAVIMWFIFEKLLPWLFSLVGLGWIWNWKPSEITKTVWTLAVIIAFVAFFTILIHDGKVCPNHPLLFPH